MIMISLGLSSQFKQINADLKRINGKVSTIGAIKLNIRIYTFCFAQL